MKRFDFLLFVWWGLSVYVNQNCAPIYRWIIIGEYHSLNPVRLLAAQLQRVRIGRPAYGQLCVAKEFHVLPLPSANRLGGSGVHLKFWFKVRANLAKFINMVYRYSSMRTAFLRGSESERPSIELANPTNAREIGLKCFFGHIEFELSSNLEVLS